MKWVVEKTTGGRECNVNDLSQADFGRLEIDFAEVKMPGLMACRAEFGPFQPFKGARITVSSHITTQTAVLIETLTKLRAQVHWCSSNMSSTQDHAAAAIARDSASIFAWKGETTEEYWRCIDRALDWGTGGGPDLIVDLGGDATVLIHEGVKAEQVYAKTGQLPDPSSTDNAELQIVLIIIRDGLKTDPMRYHNMMEGLVGVSVETTIGIRRLYQMQANGTLLFPAINVNDSITKSKFSNLYDYRHALLDGLKRATDMTIYEKRAVVCGYDDASEGCAMALKQAGADVVVFEVDPNHALQALLRGFSVIETLDDVVPEADIIVANINSGSIDVFNNVKKMKNSAIIYDMDPLLDHNRNLYAELEQNFPGMKHVIVDPQTDKWIIPETNSSITVMRNTGNPSFMLSWSCTSHVVAMLDLWSKRAGSGKYEKKVYRLSEHLEEKVSELHLPKLTTKSMMTTKNETQGHAGDHHVSVQKESDKKRILVMVVQACSVMGMVALGVMKASKVDIDLPFHAIWGD